MTADGEVHRRTPPARASPPSTPPALESCEISELVQESEHVAFFRGRLSDGHVPVIIKVCRSLNDSARVAAWIARDHRITRALRSNCVARTLAIEQVRAEPILVYADEGAVPLEAIAGRGALGIEAVLSIGSVLAEGVDELHKENLVHGNLNTRTVWFVAPDAIRIFDFGCARYASIDQDAHLEGFTDPLYVAPEQTGRTHASVDRRSDIYAMGVILCRLLGELPFDGAELPIPGDISRTVEPGLLQRLGSRALLPLAKIILKCLASDPSARYFRASGLKSDLLNCLSDWRLKGAIGEFELGRDDVASLLQISGRLYGRERETGLLKDFVRTARRGPPAVLLIKGPPGVGKSTFVRQLNAFVRNENGRLVSGKFDQFKRDIPYFSLVQAFQQLVDQLLAESEERLARWRSRILSAVGNCAQIVIDVIPELELIVGPQRPVPHLSPTETRNRFNRVFANLIQAFAQSDNPFFLFMDDLQWCDPASLELIGHVLTHANTKHFLFVGAYRPADIGSSHPLEKFVHGIEAESIDARDIDIRDLGIGDVVQLVRETLFPSDTDVVPLAELMHSRTQGNPLYVTQLLHLLHDKRLVAFDLSTGTWHWDLDEIQTEAVTADILDLLNMRMRTLPPATREILSTAACIGSTFDADRLAAAAEKPDALLHLVDCIDADLLVAVDDAGNNGPSRSGVASPPRRFRFLHDRIQQAAFGLVPDEEQKQFRCTIGRRLLAQLTPEDKKLAQFDVLNNLNHAWHLLETDAEKQDVAHLNLVAGRKARESLAYRDALHYLSVGINLLDPDAWDSCYELAFELHVNALECEYLTGGFVRADTIFRLLIERSRSILDRSKVYHIKILLDTCEERYENAVRVGIEALRLFGIRFVRNPGMPHLVGELVLARVRMRWRRPRDLLRAKRLSDPEKLAALDILVALFPTAYFLSPNLLLFTGLKVVNYSLREGISPLAATGFVLYGLGLGAAFDKYEAGYEFGRFAVDLAEQGGADTVLCKVLVIFAEFIKFWRDPVADSFSLVDRARRLALQVGDHQYVNYAIIGSLSLNFSQGLALNEFVALCELHEDFVMASKDAFPAESFSMWKNCAQALLGNDGAMRSLTHDAPAVEERYRKTGNLTLLSYRLTLRTQLLYLLGRHNEAFAVSEAGQGVIGSAPGYITVADHYLYRGLAAAGLLLADRRARRLRRVVRSCRERLRLFATNCRANFLPYLLLLQAEEARAGGRQAIASKLYNEAIDASVERGLPHLVGMASERAAVACLAEGQRRLAAWYLATARAAYVRWGATAKVALLDREFAELRALAPALPAEPVSRSTDMAPSSQAPFDVAAAAAEVSQAIAVGEQDRLLVNLMHIIRAHAGASRAHLIVRRYGACHIEASAGSEAAAGARDADRYGGFSPSVVNYVIRTRRDLMVVDPHLDTRFGGCEYLMTYRPKSVMCVPIVQQQEMLGTVYLEHRGIARAFDQQELRWLRILTPEIGLALSNARLSRYRDYLHRFAPAIAVKEIDADPYSPNLALHEEDASVLFVDLAGYSRMGELIDRDRVDDLVNRTFGEFLDDIHRFHGALLRVRGDELFVIFQDDDARQHASNAANAALAIQRTASHFSQYRSPDSPAIVANIGLNSGMMTIGLQPIEASAGAHWRYDATGPTVNVAARAREFASDGSIVMSDVTADRIGEAFALEEIGEHLLKNISEPVRLYRLRGNADGRPEKAQDAIRTEDRDYRRGRRGTDRCP